MTADSEEIISNLNEINSALPEHVTLVAVSKTHPNEALEAAYKAGQRIFGENKVQELVDKEAALPKDIEWHLIGHLQRNKVKYIASFVHLIHAVDSEKLLKEINKRAAQEERVIKVLLQMHIAEESSKFGFDEPELMEFLNSGRITKFENILVMGLMGMATFTDDSHQVRKEFASLKNLFDRLKGAQFPAETFTTLSMGMSGDFQLAIEEGSTMVRVGSSIFGAREYQ